MQFCSLSPSISLQLGMRTVEVCRCDGITGSCNVKICINKTRDYAEIAQVMPGKYHSAVAVSVDSSGELESADGANDPTDDHLVYSCGTPYTCMRNEYLGIPGTSGRECNGTDSTAPNSCERLCCGRGYYTVTTEEPIEECKFVFCCYFDCKIVSIKVTIKYYCRW